MLTKDIIEQLEFGTVVVETPEGTAIYRRINGFEARNYDGKHAGWEPSEPQGQEELIEKEFRPKGKKSKARYTNYW